jgi:carbonic anhydrase
MIYWFRQKTFLGATYLPSLTQVLDLKTFEKLMLENKSWAHDKVASDPDFFSRLADDQNPEVLWIGCSDSRVPAEIIINAQPGEMFVHRNISNQVITTDFNSLSVLEYLVDVLKVKHVIVCGRFNCGGIRTALRKQNPKLLMVNKSLKHLKDVHRIHQAQLDSLGSEDEQVARLVELNVIEQIYNLAHTSIIQSAWKSKSRPTLHGWVYGLTNGIIKELISLTPGSQINPAYQYSFDN